MYRFATLLALLVALAAAGCGGSGDDTDSPPPAVAQTGDADPSSGDAGKTASNEPQKKKNDAAEKSAEDQDEADDQPDSPEEAQDVALAKAPLDEQSALIETVVRSALLRFGLKLVDVEVRNGGRKATAVVARKGVCNFVASQEPNLVLTVKQGAPRLKSIRFNVAGTGQELGYYVVGCEKPEMPSGAGRVVLEHSGVGGPYTSKRFKITSKHWALEWVNEAASLAVVVVPVGGESKDGYFKPVGSKTRDSGRNEYTGRGTFQIKAHGAGGWQLRVKEIG